MTIGNLDRRSSAMLVAGAALLIPAAAWRFGLFGGPDTGTAAAAEAIPAAESRLESLRVRAATVTGKEARLRQAQAELASREKGILKADTKSQAQAQLLELVEAIAKANGIEVHGVEHMGEAAISGDYGEVSVDVAFVCGIDQLVNLMAALADQPQILATNELRVNGGNDKKKNIQVHLAVGALVARKLLPEKKGGPGA
ncbi:MAG: type II secretion system protein GspM [Bryobacteraceae bacterium]